MPPHRPIPCWVIRRRCKKPSIRAGPVCCEGAKTDSTTCCIIAACPLRWAPAALKSARTWRSPPGSVVYRSEVFELIEYHRVTATVRERPVLLVPPVIGKYYFLDMAPGRSFIEYAVSRGLHFFTISWRNPNPEHAAWNLDTYAAVLEALGVVREIAGAEVNAHGFCAGGLVLSAALNHSAAQGKCPVNAASFGVMLLDFEYPMSLGAFLSAPLLKLALQRSAKSGVTKSTRLRLKSVICAEGSGCCR
ncbi:hypothetical protein [Pseudomonas gingeri]|uniref:hypothetical protein n=1 Tax=Pseudomonas gingeri TaxID=117681 RepID=UPI0023EF40A9|nr:hypothetical protein [Pseudomonas gingeri]